MMMGGYRVVVGDVGEEFLLPEGNVGDAGIVVGLDEVRVLLEEVLVVFVAAALGEEGKGARSAGRTRRGLERREGRGGKGDVRGLRARRGDPYRPGKA